MPLALQGSLLRVLQESEVTPLGGTKPIPVDLRIIVATHRDLDAMVVSGDFRRDLLARLSGLAIELPPLRERREDLGLLIAALLRKMLGEGAARVTFAVQAARALLLHPWPLNVRELEKALGVATALAQDGRVELDHLPAAIRAPPPPSSTGSAAPPTRPLPPRDQAKRDELAALLREHKGNVTEVARVIGKARVQIQRWLKRYGINAAEFRE